MRCSEEARGSHSGLDQLLAEAAKEQAYLGHSGRGRDAVSTWSARLMV